MFVIPASIWTTFNFLNCQLLKFILLETMLWWKELLSKNYTSIKKLYKYNPNNATEYYNLKYVYNVKFKYYCMLTDRVSGLHHKA